MNNIRILVNCIFGPKVNAFYRLTGHTLASTTPQILQRTHRYQPSSLETASDYVIRATKFITYLGAYVSPVLLAYLVYKRNVPGTYINSLDNSTLVRLVASAISILACSLCIRGYARYSNPEYLQFLDVVDSANKNPSVSTKRILVHCDADFSAFPVDFNWSDAKDKGPTPPSPYRNTFPDSSASPQLILDNIGPLKWPLELTASIIMKTIGRRMVYPGSLKLLQVVMEPAISAGRLRLIEECDGVRYKLKSYDGNSIDTMHVDRQGRSPNGDYLIIGCEGNGGFYEVGTIMTALEAGYSVLGWNHPGFGGSTGIPYPDQDVAAVDTVIKFAIERINYAPNRIFMYGWSIGGFTATWAGMRHPKLGGLVVDASFDHILPLARNLFPGFLYPFVELAIRQHFDLDNSRHLQHYKGPILLIRRSQDEVISTDPHNSPPNNRANYLLLDLLKSRFPKLMDDRAVRVVKEYLGGNERYQNGVLRRYSVNNSACGRLLTDYFYTHARDYPIEIGPNLDLVTRDQLVLFLASKFMIDYDSVHCAPLPARYLQRPWDLLQSNQTTSGSNL